LVLGCSARQIGVGHIRALQAGSCPRRLPPSEGTAYTTVALGQKGKMLPRERHHTATMYLSCMLDQCCLWIGGGVGQTLQVFKSHTCTVPLSPPKNDAVSPTRSVEVQTIKCGPSPDKTGTWTLRILCRDTSAEVLCLIGTVSIKFTSRLTTGRDGLTAWSC